MIFAPILGVSLLLQAAVVAPDLARQQSEQEAYVVPFMVMAEPPKLPKVDLNSCPFEGCRFGKWTARVSVVVYSTWEPSRKPIATLSRNEEVIAVTGVNVVLQPGKGIFDRDVPLFGAKKGDTAFLYRNCGEGEADIWVHGRFIPCAAPQFSSSSGDGCQKNCDGRWLSPGKSEWWAQIRLKDGTTGWVRVEGNFDGVDGLR